MPYSHILNLNIFNVAVLCPFVFLFLGIAYTIGTLHLILANVIFYGVAAVIIAALASLIPAWQASRNEPAESLHHV